MNRPCPWCNLRPVVYESAEHCSYACYTASLQVRCVRRQLDLFEGR